MNAEDIAKRCWRWLAQRRTHLGLAAVATGIASLTVPTGGRQGQTPTPEVASDPRQPIEIISGDPDPLPKDEKLPGPGSGPGGGGPGGGGPGGGESFRAALACEDPLVVAFVSNSERLTSDDGDGRLDVFANNHGSLRRISRDLPGLIVDTVTAGPAISATGEVVAYGALLRSGDSTTGAVVVTALDGAPGRVLPSPERAGGRAPGSVTLSPDGTVVAWEVAGGVYAYLLESAAPEPTLVSATPSGQLAGTSSSPAVSDLGTQIAYASSSPSIDPADTNGVADVFVVSGLLTTDSTDDAVRRFPSSVTGGQADGPSGDPSLSRDGRRLAFESTATNLVVGDRNATADVFVTDLSTGATRAVTQGNGPSGDPALSCDGTSVSFTSKANDIVPGDGNGPLPNVPTPTSFHVVDRQGRLTYGTEITAIDGPRVRVRFPSPSVPGASGAGVDGGAVVDWQTVPVEVADGRSDVNPPATLRHGTVDPDLTDGPDLVAVAIVNATGETEGSAAPSGGTSRVRYAFDEALSAVVAPDRRPPSEDAPPEETQGVSTARFLLQGYNSAIRVASVRALVDPSDPAAVLVEFPSGVDPSRYTLAVALATTVVDEQGLANPVGSRRLSGNRVAAEPGDVTGPNLRSADPDRLANRATFSFDAIRPSEPERLEIPPRFGFVDRNGTFRPGQAIVSSDGTGVIVQFAADADPLGAAVRFVVLPDAVRNTADEPNVEQSTDGDAAGPELVSIAVVDQSPSAIPTYDFTFNAPVIGVDPSRFAVLTEDGTRFPVAGVERPKPEVVRLTVPSVARFAGSVVLGIAQPRAVFERVGTLPGQGLLGAPNPLGVAPIAAPASARGGLTDGPDLVRVDLLGELSEVDYYFDDDVASVRLATSDQELPGSGEGSDVFVVVLDGAGGPTRVSVDPEGDEASGSAGSSSLSEDGRFVIFESTSPLVGADRDVGLDVFRRDLFDLSSAPPILDLGEAPVGSQPGAGAPVTTENRGSAPGVIHTVRVGGRDASDFTVVANSCSGSSLPPRSSCAVAVAFAPTAAGQRVGLLLFEDGIRGVVHEVALAGVGLLPTLGVSPAVGPPGSVALVEGTGFPRDIDLELRWAPPVAADGETPASDFIPLGPTLKARTDSEGNFRGVPLLIMRKDARGPRMIEARQVGADSAGPLAIAQFLVVPGTLQPGSRDGLRVGRILGRR